MKTLKIVVDTTNLQLSPEELAKSTQAAVIEGFKSIILNYGNQSQRRGLTEEERRLFYKMLDIFDAAIKSNAESVELEDTQFGFLKKAKREVTLTPNLFTRRVEELVDAVEDR